MLLLSKSIKKLYNQINKMKKSESKNMKEKQKVVLASDHAGYALKESVKAYLQEKGYTIDDVGAHKLVADDDYPQYMVKAAMKIFGDGTMKAIIFGWSGQGEAMVANRFPGVRAAVWYGGGEKSNGAAAAVDIIKLSREHNDANVLSIGAGFVSEAEAKEAVVRWLQTPFSHEERHARRIAEIDAIE
jgi:ribose 5-phosphate isomerase B